MWTHEKAVWGMYPANGETPNIKIRTIPCQAQEWEGVTTMDDECNPVE